MVAVVDTALWQRYEFLSIPGPELAWLRVAAVPGVYVFCGPGGGLWEPYYIGIARNLNRRLRRHPRLRDALDRGATHVHILANVCPFERRAIEQSLVRHHDPALNDRLRDKRRSGTVPGDWVSDEAYEQVEELQRQEFEARQFWYEITHGPAAEP